MSLALPDAERLYDALVRHLSPLVNAQTGMVGIQTGGAWVAERLHRDLGLVVPLGTLNISFYRDDYTSSGLHANVRPSRIPFDVNGRSLLLVDDVLFTGRTVRGAMNELFDYGRPESIGLVVLVDRGGRQLPICAQIVGATLAVPPGAKLDLQRDAAGRLSLHLEEGA
ncbi:MAG: bifunctional pyr operon transcriptional regulator/uracil phosphoribosyltransferase PyrR [Burkholderiales bacterium]|nr:bifunctional pyr operon transcriptional regulator/uracil phosphoribosyltransferase PyrR [Burkholderiales bacterium]